MACAVGAARTNILARQSAISQDDLVTNSHPLDPLSADEIRQAAAILRRDRKIGDGWRFASIELKEPAKDVLPNSRPAASRGFGRRSWSAGTVPTARRAAPPSR